MSGSHPLGKVYLVGAGPGDPDLITVKGLNVLKQAEVLLYDHLVHPSLLAYSPKAQVVCVGKRKGLHSQRQDEINELMLAYARQGLSVVRLKGGDPLMFGRGGEEIEFLRGHGIPYEIVPGLTSAVAVTAFAGIPLTHRLFSKSVAFVTATTRDGSPINEASIPIADTLVCFMGVSHLEVLSKKLALVKGFSAQTPAALIYRGTFADQKVAEGTLATIAQIQKTQKIGTPALLVVGEVVRLGKTLSWAQKLPLNGKRIILLRTVEQSQELKNKLSALGAEVVLAPAIQIKPLPAQIKRLTKSLIKKTTMIILTSKNGVDLVIQRLLDLGLDSRSLAGKQIVAVGPKTAELLRSFGLIADLIPKPSNADAILKVLPKRLSHHHVLVPTAEESQEDFLSALEKRRAQVTKIGLYRTEAMKFSPAFGTKNGDVVVFTSGSTARSYFEQMDNTLDILAICIGAQTEAVVRQFYSGKICVSKEATPESLLAVIMANL